MKNFYDNESRCAQVFYELGKCYHLWTPENFELIFSSDEDFRVGMNIIGICSILFPQLKILTFELMSNHFHFTIVGDEETIRDFFECVKKFLSRYIKKNGRVINWANCEAKMREITTLEDVRNVIVYNNRNGFVVSRDYTPYTYPWGANRYYFNPDAVKLANHESRHMTVKERASYIHSRVADHIIGPMVFDGCATPLSFCDITTGERLFRDPCHYFHLLTKNIESQKAIAKEISESIFYTDDELFSAISAIAKNRFGCNSPSQVPASAKLELARLMRFEYHSSTKQIQRILKIDEQTLRDMFKQ